MASNINPNNIDTTYPIAGQDNDSQGFRDNFTNIKSNFEFAETEIDDLQSKVLLKSALTGTSLDNDMNGSVLDNAKLQSVRYTKVDSSSTSGTITINFADGNYHNVGTLTGAATLAFTGIPAAGNYAEWTVEFTQPASPYTVIMPSAVSVGNAVIQGAIANNQVTFNKAGTNKFRFASRDGGTTVQVEDLLRNNDPIYLPSSEDLAASGAASLAKTTSYFSTGGTETATLAAGVEGQIKVFAMYSDGGDMTITVTNAGWKSSGTGTIAFDTLGDSCTLMYINSKWFCIGNNGAVFA